MSTVDDTYSSSIAGAVRGELGRQRKSVSALAVFLGVSRETASSRVNGGSVWNVDELERAAVFLGITVDDINELAELGRRIDARRAEKKAAA